jgi:nucleotide-binding universal stress UspA family protein
MLVGASRSKRLNNGLSLTCPFRAALPIVGTVRAFSIDNAIGRTNSFCWLLLTRRRRGKHMNAKKILLPIDFSYPSDAALPYAASLAKESNAQLLILHVDELPLAYGGEMYYGLLNPSRDELMKMLQNIKPADPSIPVAHHLVEGNPVGAIVRFAKDENVDLIVIGSHGRTGIGRALMGSVAEGVVRKAHCPVLVYKQPTAGPATASTA